MTDETILHKMNNLIAQPLLAAAKSNAELAMSQTRFMLEHCFTREEKNGTEVYSPKMITLNLSREVIIPGSPAIPATDTQEAVAATEPRTEEITTTFKLPILSIIPLNSLAMNSVEVSLDLPDSVFGKEVTQGKINISAEQLPIPQGMNVLIQAFANSIQPITQPNV